MNLQARPLGISGCFVARLPVLQDARGGFQKLFHAPAFGDLVPELSLQEAYLTTSQKNVLRGMHFQVPPHDHAKVVVCLTGAVTDVILDLRSGDGFGAVESVALAPDGDNCVILPKGVAHGFCAHADNSGLLYLVETVHAPEHDAGIAWDGFGFDWPVRDPILSDRDLGHPSLAEFVAPASWCNP
ncbi:dTDP-4-dehydrorhamnose 3,5-epimerase family protein [uncultured Tateyamaria sp.]|uniref:dTDP-4-dehydrorhamnose 3,5-epimerase family protein n=1 Tax=uncultured Tateyamaria sp. TaxID=455651 RepID=UPI00262ACCE1|nr:dTDP-4-dehydrorhamnose 3,5-epimerase family protein [uncultured Tateyamaria sp.]